jgi:hypothetical protein
MDIHGQGSWEKSNLTSCWPWSGKRNNHGYPKRGRIYVHREIAVHFLGPIPAGFHVHHKCKNPPCCRPDHLEIVSPLKHLTIEPRHLIHGKYAGRFRSKEKPRCYVNGCCLTCGSSDLRLYSGRWRCRPCQSANSKRYHQRKKAGELGKVKV